MTTKPVEIPAWAITLVSRAAILSVCLAAVLVGPRVGQLSWPSWGGASVKISADGPRGLLLIEDGYANEDGEPYLDSQIAMLSNSELRLWLNEAFGVGNWRIIDPSDYDLEHAPEWLRELMDHYEDTEGHDSPWVIASDGSRGVNAEMADDLDSLKKQLEGVTE